MRTTSRRRLAAAIAIAGLAGGAALAAPVAAGQETVADNGFRPQADGYSFLNYAGTLHVPGRKNQSQFPKFAAQGAESGQQSLLLAFVGASANQRLRRLGQRESPSERPLPFRVILCHNRIELH